MGALTMIKKLGFSYKDIFYIFIIGALVVVGYFKYRGLMESLNRQEIAYKQLSETLARASSQMVTKTELEKLAKELNIDIGSIKKDLADLNAQLVALGTTVATIKEQVETGGSDNQVPSENGPVESDESCKFCDVHGYTAKTQIKELKLGKMPYGTVSFDASKKKPWTIKYDAIDIVVDTVVGKDKNNQLIFYHTISTINKSRPSLLNKKFKLKVVSSIFKQTKQTQKRFYWWAPHISIGIDQGFPFRNPSYVLGSSLNFSVMGYGLTKDDNDWRLIKIGVGYNTRQKPYFSVIPFEYNIGKMIPLISDLWIGVGVAYDSNWIGIFSIGTTL